MLSKIVVEKSSMLLKNVVKNENVVEKMLSKKYQVVKNVVKKVVEKSCWKLKCCQESCWMPGLQNTGKPVFDSLKRRYSCNIAKRPTPFLVSTTFFTTLLLLEMLLKIVVEKLSMLLKML